MKRALNLSIVFFLIASIVAFIGASQGIKGDAIVTVNDMSELASEMTGATEDTIIQLSNSFDTNLTSQTAVTLNNGVNITVDGNGKTLDANLIPADGNVNNAKHLKVTNNGAGTVSFMNIVFVGESSQTGSAITKGGLVFSGGSYAFDNVVVTNTRSGVILANVAAFAVNNSTFANNYRSEAASAIHGEGGVQNLDIQHSSFVNNLGGQGYGYSSGAIWVKNPRIVTVNYSYFKDNASHSTGGGGAIAFTVANENTINIMNSYFEGNQANGYPGGSSWADGGAIYYFGAGSSTPYFNVDSCTFVNNYAHDDGGAILLEAPSPNAQTSVSNSTFVENWANGQGPQGYLDSSGGGIQVSIDSKVELINNTFYKNVSGGVGTLYSDQKGGAIGTHNESGRDAIINSYNNIFLGNYALDGSGDEINPEYANVAAPVFNDVTSVGVDNGTLVDSSIVNGQRIFGTDTPLLLPNYDSTLIGNPNGGDTMGYLPTIPIVPGGLADSTGTATSITTDARQYLRGAIPDVGAVEMVYLQFDANGGQWEGLPLLTGFDGTLYYEGTDPVVYYRVTYPGGSEATLDNSNLVNGDRVFLGWASTPDATVAEYGAGVSFTLNENKVLYAVWETSSQDYTVTFESNGGSEVPEEVVASGSKVTQPLAPVREGFKFLGWYVDSNYSRLWDFEGDVVVEDMTLYARWEVVTNGGGSSGNEETPKDNGNTYLKIPKTGSGIMLFTIGTLLAGTVIIASAFKRKNIR